MPTRAIPFALAALVAAGIVVYQNREHILELMERGRQKLKKSLNSFADNIAQARERELPYERQRSNSDSYRNRRNSSDRDFRREVEVESFLGSSSFRRRSTDGLRQRGIVSGHESYEDTLRSVLFDASNPNNIPLSEIPPPLPPRRPITPPQNTEENQQAPTKSSPETARYDSVSSRLDGTFRGPPSPALVLSTPPAIPTSVAPVLPPRPSSSRAFPTTLKDVAPAIPAVAVGVPDAAVAAEAPAPPAAPTEVTQGAPVAVSSSSPHSTPSASVILPPFESAPPEWSIHEWASPMHSPPPSSPSLAVNGPEDIGDEFDVHALSDDSDTESDASYVDVLSNVSGDD